MCWLSPSVPTHLVHHLEVDELPELEHLDFVAPGLVLRHLGLLDHPRLLETPPVSVQLLNQQMGRGMMVVKRVYKQRVACIAPRGQGEEKHKKRLLFAALGLVSPALTLWRSLNGSYGRRFGESSTGAPNSSPSSLPWFLVWGRRHHGNDRGNGINGNGINGHGDGNTP